MASSAVGKRHPIKVTEEDSEGEYHGSNNDEVHEKNHDLFFDSNTDESMINNTVMDKGDTKTGSDTKGKLKMMMITLTMRRNKKVVRISPSVSCFLQK